MPYVELVAILAIIQFLTFGGLTATARMESGIKAPATTGNEAFERMYRVQMNTLEVLVPFLTALFIAANHWPEVLIASLGALYLVGRLLYWRAYVKDPLTRGNGFLLSFSPIVLLVALALIGIILSITGLNM